MPHRSCMAQLPWTLACAPQPRFALQRLLSAHSCCGARSPRISSTSPHHPTHPTHTRTLATQGDNDPVDVVEIGSQACEMGGVYQVKPLGERSTAAQRTQHAAWARTRMQGGFRARARHARAGRPACRSGTMRSTCRLEGATLFPTPTRTRNPLPRRRVCHDRRWRAGLEGDCHPH